jgi:2-iminobutanoate/2-iminopropanoate deaminase
MQSNTQITRIFSTAAPAPLGHYEQAVLHADTLYVSGQLGVTVNTPDPNAVSVADQILFALGNIEMIARLIGADRNQFIKTTVYITDVAHWRDANVAYASFFGDHKPARSVVPCKDLHLNSKIEIEAMLAVPG